MTLQNINMVHNILFSKTSHDFETMHQPKQLINQSETILLKNQSTNITPKPLQNTLLFSNTETIYCQTIKDVKINTNLKSAQES